ncbi:uncharacterized protein LOC125504009 [Dendroctonus ponderosae]|uniref:uncharacterized protein LOC125504009 n=1 Tax=Dendroctonus ponderosae TaxID=77166 RepID=UPI002034B278|nr:uncharacterized protein LOC125504009 [Dendroctonus ponderosae]KAH1013377.1 hypothetical protein HUJ04_002372 [Dendroctonus ponderosae]KAH1024706.1 hypothetical protein HUJ05_004157 [Dendroctonus ponderosae]
MSLEHKEVQSDLNFGDTFKQEVFHCIAYITHKCPLMQKLFCQWALLTSRQQILLNYIAFYALDQKEMVVFAGIIKGLQFWDALQDTEGACGYHQNPLEFSFNREQEKQIFNVILDISKMISTISAKMKVCSQLLEFKACSRQQKFDFEPISPDRGDN